MQKLFFFITSNLFLFILKWMLSNNEMIKNALKTISYLYKKINKQFLIKLKKNKPFLFPILLIKIKI